MSDSFNSLIARLVAIGDSVGLVAMIFGLLTLNCVAFKRTKVFGEL